MFSCLLFCWTGLIIVSVVFLECCGINVQLELLHFNMEVNFTAVKGLTNLTIITQRPEGLGFNYYRELISVFYLVGTLANLLAFIHLNQKKNFKNTKHALMLKCLVSSDFLGLIGMLTQMHIKFYAPKEIYEKNIFLMCGLRILWRFFGFSSGCVSFVMAVERYIALTKPFFYCKHITNGVIKRSILAMWTFAAILTFAPLFGVGIYYDGNEKKCLRYRDADDVVDVTYAFVFFIVGSVLCINMVICNFSVTRIVYRSYRSMQMTLGSIDSSDSWNRTSSNKLRHRTSELSANTNKSLNLITRDELKFVTMINCLTTSFVVCWGCQMITIPIAQFIKNANKLPNVLIFYKIADILILIHFGLDPFIYVLMKTNYWMRFKSFVCELKFCKTHKKKFLALPSSTLDCQL